MALDVYVMPLWKFKAGEFKSALEVATGIQPRVITSDWLTQFPPPSPWYIRLLRRVGLLEEPPPPPPPEPELTPEERRAEALQEVNALKRELTSLTGTTVDWPDNGEMHYNRQFGSPVMLRAFAAWCNHRDEITEFVPAPKENYYEHPIWQVAKAPHRRFSTLIEHSLHAGYFLPVPFAGMHQVEPFIAWRREFHHHVASTQSILGEVVELHSVLAAIEPVTVGGEPQVLEELKWYADELQHICNLSLEHRLPVVFYG